MNSRGITPERIKSAYLRACELDVTVLKPGNVSVNAPGHGMTAANFLASARASTASLVDPDLRLGERIFRAVSATHDRVRCNTNLGILLLCAPLAQACLESGGRNELRSALSRVLRQTTVADTEQLFAAIRLAGPAGLGRSADHDVRLAARVSIREAMAEAALRDSIARQYVTDYEDIFQRALPHLADARGRLDDRRAAVTDLYLSLLATIPDSHVRRKHGERVASRVTTQAARTYRAWASGAGRAAAPDLRDLDARLKKAGVNPGTTADLTVATLFLDRLLAAPVRHAGTRHRHFLRQLHFALCGSPLVSTMSMT